MKYVIGAIWLLLCAGVLLAMISGRVRLRGCCGATDAACDLRLRDSVQAQSRPDTVAGTVTGAGADKIRTHW